MKLILIIYLFFLYSLNLYSQWSVLTETNLLEMNDNPANIFVDSKNNYWFYTGGSFGVYRYDGFNTYYFDTSNTNLPYTDISSIDEDENGIMYFGTYEDQTPNENTSIIILKGNEWSYLNKHNSSLNELYGTEDIFPINENEFWLATVIGLIYYNNGEVTSFYFNDDLFKRHIRNFFQDKEDNLYVHSFFGDIHKITSKNNKFELEKIDTPFRENYGSIYAGFDIEARLWRFSTKSIDMRNENKIWTRFDSTHFNSNHPISFYISKDGNVYCNTERDVFKYLNESWEHFVSFPEKFIAAKDTVYSNSEYLRLSAIDNNGKILFTPSKYKGIVIFDPKETNVQNKNNTTIYPNPTSNIINIDTEYKVNIELFDIFGNKLLEDYNTKLDISKLSPGTYFIRYSGHTKMVVKI